MTSAFARIVSKREEASKKGAHALCFKKRKIFADLFRSSSPVLVFTLWTLTTFVEVDHYRLMISDVVKSKIAGLLRSLMNNARDPRNIEFPFNMQRKR